jgi:hypothetical protein
MTVLSTCVFKPANGRIADAIENLKTVEQLAIDSGATRAGSSRVLTGPAVGNLQMRMFTEDLEHLGEVSNAMYASAAMATLNSNDSPPSELINLIRSDITHRAVETSTADGITVGSVVGLQVHPGMGEVLHARLVDMADAWVQVGAAQSMVTASISGPPGPAMFLTTFFKNYADLSKATIDIRSTKPMQAIRSSTSTSGTIMANFHMSRL